MLTLDNVSVAGNHATVSWFTDGDGGGVELDGANCTLIMKHGAQIAFNKAEDEGGGVYSNGTGTVIELTGGSSIHHNIAIQGGGVYFCDSQFILRSPDRNGSVFSNTADSTEYGYGGGIYTEQCPASTNAGLIYGLIISNNWARMSGGGLFLNQENTTISRCAIQSNRSDGSGGGIYVNNDENVLSNSTVTGNVSTYYGAGVAVFSQSNFGLNGTIVIEGNRSNSTYGYGDPDNLLLDTATFSDAYIEGVPSTNSRIHIRVLGDKVDRKLNASAGFYDASIFTYDGNDVDGGRHVEYDSSSGKLLVKEGKQTASTPTFKEVTVGEYFDDDYDSYNNKAVIRGIFRYPAVMNTDEELTSNFYYSDGYFLNGGDGTNGDPRVYNPHLATMSMALVLAGCCSNIGLDDSMLSEKDKRYDLDYTYKSQNIELPLTEIGIAPEDIYFSENCAVKPGADTIGVFIGKKTIKDNYDSSKEYTLVPIVVRSVGYESEWASNFTLGSKGEAQGFASAADQVVAQVQVYLQEHDLIGQVEAGKVKFWIMGYSRGGGVANLAAKRLIENYCYRTNEAQTPTGSQVYAYCIAAPQGGRNSEMKLTKECYYSIHNCINKVDPVTELAPDEMGFMRYGVDHYVPGTATTSATPTEEAYTWNFLKDKEKDQAWMSGYRTWSDNKSWTVGSADYNAQREKMLAQLASIDPVNIRFYDSFAIAEQDILPPSTDALSYSGTPITQEEFIHVLVRGIEAWGLYEGYNGDFRNGYNGSFSDGAGVAYPSFESAIQVVVPLWYGLSPSEREGVMSSISAGVDSLIGSVWGKVWRGVKLYNDVIGDWCNLKQSYRDRYLGWTWEYLMETADPLYGKTALSYLSSEDQVRLHAVWNVLMDVVFRFLAGDYNNDVSEWGSSTTPVGDTTVDVADRYAENYKNYGNHSLVVLGTILNNTASISQGHYPEINYAWLRSYDSFYKGDGNQPLTLKSSITPAVTIGVEGRLMTLTTETVGAPIYYRISKDNGGSYGSWMPYNKVVTLPEGSIKVQYTAIYCGNRSEVETAAYYIAPGTETGLAVTVNGTIVGNYAAGATVTIDGTGTGEQVFKSWSKVEGISNDAVAELNMSNAILSFTMPKNNVALTAEYVTRTKDVTLTVAKPVAGEALPTAGRLSWAVGETTTEKRNVPVYWLEQVGDDTQLASGTAKYGTKYSVAALVEQDLVSSLAFSFDLEEAGTAKVKYSDTDAENANAAYTNAAGALRIFGKEVETDKLTLTEAPTAAITLAAGATKADLVAALPASVTVTLNETPTVFALDLDKANTKAVMNDDGTVKAGTVTIPIVGTTNSLTVNVTVESGETVEAPTADAEKTEEAEPVADEPAAISLLVADPTTLNVTAANETKDETSAISDAGTKVRTFKDVTSVTVTLTAEDGATIMYELDGGDPQTYTAPFALTGAEGQKTTHVLTTWAETRSGRSSDVTYTYVLDDPYTVTIDCRDTGTAGLLPGTTAWTKTVTFSYYSGEEVTIAAPAEADELFDKWESIPSGKGIAQTDTKATSLTVGSISNDIELTAIYNPVINRIDLTLDAPTVGKALPETLTSASVTVTNSYPMAEYFKEITWTPNAGTAAAGTVYTAKLELDFDAIKQAAKDKGLEEKADGLKYLLSENLTIDVNGSKGIKASVSKANDAIYLTFPAATAQTSATGVLASVDKLSPVVVSYEKAEQNSWGLPTTATLRLTDGSTAYGAIEWTKTPTFSEKQLAYTATGTVTLPDGVTNKNKVSLDVSLSILVAKQESSVSMPRASAASGTYEGTQYVRLTCTDPAASIYYTLDGSDPTARSTAYTENANIIISAKTTLKAIAVKGNQVSEVVVYDYTITAPSSGSHSSKPATPVPTETVDYKSCAKGSACPVAAFADASAAAWYHDGLHYCLDNGLMNGYSATAFGPNDSLTRAQVVTVLWRIAGSPAVTGTADFSDVAADAWYAAAVRWAAEHSIVLGYADGSFRPNDSITREQFAALLYRYAAGDATGDAAALDGYSDAASVSSWAREAIQWACQAGILNGADGKLMPQGSATRAQSAAIFQRFSELGQ